MTEPPPLPPDPAAPPASPAGPETAPGAAGPVIEDPHGPRTLTFSCTACGGGLAFSPLNRTLVCPQCGREEPISGDDTPPGERDLHAVLAAGASPHGPSPAERPAPEGLGQELVCPNCHGRVGFVGTLTATRCPFCAAPVQRSDIAAAPDRLPVDGIVPFGIDQNVAQDGVDQWIAGRWFAPNGFKKYSRTGSFAGVYLPFFTFDADTVTDYTGQRGDNYTVTVGSGKNRRTETRIRWRHASGTVGVGFDDVAIGAENSLEPDRMRNLEPWPTGQAVTFRPEYVAGKLARSYDRDLATCHVDAQARMTEDIERTVRSDIGGDHQRIHRMDTSWSAQTYRHLLLPLFLLVVMFKSEPYRVYVNGVTGEVHGKRPYSWIKITLAVLAALAVIGGAVGIYYATK